MITEVRNRTLEQMFDDEMLLRTEGEENFPLANKTILIDVKYEPSRDRLEPIRDEYRRNAWEFVIPIQPSEVMPF